MTLLFLLRSFAIFAFSTLFKKGELSINDTSFNPVKIMNIILLLLYIALVTYVSFKLLRIYIYSENNCPGIVRKVTDSIGRGDDEIYHSCKK